MSFLFTLLLSLTANAQYRANSLILYDAKGILGSVTHVCSQDGQNLAFITTAHEVEASSCVISSDGKTQPGCLNVTNGLSFNGLPPQGRSVTLWKIDSTKDIAILKTPMTIFDIATPGCVTSSLMQRNDRSTKAVMDIDATMDLPEKSFVLEAYDANQGRMIRQDFTASIVKTISHGLPGREGTGPLYVLKSNAIPGYSGGAVLEKTPALMGDRQELVGIILAVDDKKIVLLPAAEIFQSFVGPSRIAEKKVSGGVLYISEKAIHYRSRIKDAGTGRVSDAGNGPTNALYGSGIVFLSKLNRRWLSISHYWSEAEPFPLERRRDLQNSSRLDGIYEENGQLFATSESTPMPKFLMNFEGCISQQAVVHSNGKRSAKDVSVCSSTSDRESHFSVGVDGVTYKITLQKNCMNGLCIITRKAVKSSKHSSSELPMDGLRTILDGSNSLTIEYSGGYTLKLGSTKIVGPLL